MRARLAAARRLGFELATTSPVIAATHVGAPTELDGRRAGELLASAGVRATVETV